MRRRSSSLLYRTNTFCRSKRGRECGLKIIAPGITVDIKHLSATPVGMTIRCETELIEIDRRRLVFSCRVYDDAGLIGEGTQERFIVDNAKFMEKVSQKARS